jgi:hypothetical protein
MVSQNTPFNLKHWISHGLRWMHKNVHLPFYLSIRSVHIWTQLLLYIFPLSLIDKAWSRVFIRVAIFILTKVVLPCGGGVEYLHRNHASRRRRRKGKSWIWECKIGHESHRTRIQKMTALARTRSNCKRQTRRLVRECAPHQQICNCLTAIKIWS